MLRGGIPIGVLILNAVSEPGPFTDKQIELVTTFADQARRLLSRTCGCSKSVDARTRELAKSLEDLRSTLSLVDNLQKLASLGQLIVGHCARV